MVFAIVSYFSGFKNFQEDNCHADFFYLNIHSFEANTSASQEKQEYLTKLNHMSLMQNRVTDFYKIFIILIAFLLIFLFYLKIYVYLRMHEKKVSHGGKKATIKSNTVSPVRYVGFV